MTTLSIARTRKKPKADHPDSWIYSPEDFDPSAYPGAIKKHPMAARWLLNAIYFRRVSRNFARSEYVNLHSGLLGTIMGDMAIVRPVREALVAHGLVETDNHYIQGQKSIGYRLGPALEGTRWHRHFCADKRMIKRFEKYKEAVNTPAGFKLPVHHHLSDWCRRIEIDQALADEAIERMRLAEVSFPKGKQPKSEVALHQLDAIRQGLLHHTVCRYDRFHSNFSSVCREIRGCLKYRGVPLQEIDIVNSQPFFLSVLLLEVHLNSYNCQSIVNIDKKMVNDHDLIVSYMTKEAEEEEKRERATPYLFGLSTPVTSLPPIQDNQLEWYETFLPKDMRQLMDDVAGGKFYERFMSETGLAREGVKVKVFQVVYGQTRLMTNTEVGHAFRKLFPTAFTILEKLKTSKGHAWVGQEMQRREARIVIGTVCERLRADHPDIPVITIHDSLMSTEEHLPTILALLHEVFLRYPRQPRYRIKCR